MRNAHLPAVSAVLDNTPAHQPPHLPRDEIVSADRIGDNLKTSASWLGVATT